MIAYCSANGGIRMRQTMITNMSRFGLFEINDNNVHACGGLYS